MIDPTKVTTAAGVVPDENSILGVVTSSFEVVDTVRDVLPLCVIDAVSLPKVIEPFNRFTSPPVCETTSTLLLASFVTTKSFWLTVNGPPSILSDEAVNVSALVAFRSILDPELRLA